MNNFAKNLNDLLKQNSISQYKLAEKLNVGHQTISKYVLGKNEPNLDIIIKIADFFEVTLDELIR